MMSNGSAIGPGVKSGQVEEFIDTGRVSDDGYPIKARLSAVVAVDQYGVPVPAKRAAAPAGPDVLDVDAPATVAAVLFTRDCTGISNINLHVKTPGTATTISYYVSNTGLTGDWVAHPTTPTSTAAGLLDFAIKTAFFKAEITTPGTGNVRVIAAFK